MKKIIYKTVLKDGKFFLSLDGNSLYEIPLEINGVSNKGIHNVCPIKEGVEFECSEVELNTYPTGQMDWYGNEKRHTYFRIR